ncbi:hypothetical protein Tco_0777055, partial [Tanacetum coccineum]
QLENRAAPKVQEAFPLSFGMAPTGGAGAIVGAGVVAEKDENWAKSVKSGKLSRLYIFSSLGFED